MYAIINNILTDIKEPSLIEAKGHHHWRAPVVLTLLIQTVQLSFNVIRVTQGHRAAQCMLRVQRERCCRSCVKYFLKHVGSNFFTCQTIQPLKFPIKYKVYIFTTRSSFWNIAKIILFKKKISTTQQISEVLPLLSPARQRKKKKQKPRFKDTKTFYRRMSFLLDIPV